MKIATAAELMNKQVVTVRPSTPAEELAALFEEESVHGAPVVDDEGKLVGVVSRTDLVRALAEERRDLPPPAPRMMFEEEEESEEMGLPEPTREASRGSTLTAQELMSHEVVTAASAATAGELAKLMHRHRIHRVIIADGGKVLGVVSVTDLLPVMAAYERAGRG